VRQGTTTQLISEPGHSTGDRIHKAPVGSLKI